MKILECIGFVDFSTCAVTGFCSDMDIMCLVPEPCTGFVENVGFYLIRGWRQCLKSEREELWEADFGNVVL